MKLSRAIRETIEYRLKHDVRSPHISCPICNEMDSRELSECTDCPLYVIILQDMGLSEGSSCGFWARDIYKKKHESEAIAVFEELALACEMQGD